MNTQAVEEFVRTLPDSEYRQLDDATLTNGSAVYDKCPIEEESDCRVCPNCHFETTQEFLDHHKVHVQSPIVVLQRLKSWYIKKLISRNKPTHSKVRNKCELAKKHTQSHSPIKLTLKLASSATSTHRSFEVVAQKPRPQVLFGPGDYYTTQGYSIDDLKVEFTDTEDTDEASVEGLTEAAGEAGESLEGLERTLERPDESLNGVNESLSLPEETRLEVAAEDEEDPGSEGSYQDEEGSEEEEEESLKQVPDETDAPPDTGAKFLEAVCQETTDNLNREFDSDSNGSNSGDAPSPTPSEQLRPDFLAPVASPTPSEIPAMVEHTTLPSPDPPGSVENSRDPGDLEKTPEEGSFETTSFQWSNADITENVSTPSTDIDPLQLPGENSTASLLDESLLRSFLTEDKSNSSAQQPVTVVLNEAQLALGAEYISLDRLGDSTACCEVCGERASSREKLDEHRCKAGHYKCNRPECCSKVFPNSEELASHLRTLHPAQFPRPPMVIINQSLQSPPVQQLQQQVQRLPMPQPQSYLTQALGTSLPPMVPMSLHGAMPPPSFTTDSIRRPPPLYNPVQQQQQQQQQYSMAALNQMYSQQQQQQQQQQYRPVAPQFQQPMRQQTYMSQPMHQRGPMQQQQQQPRMQQPRAQMQQQKRPSPLPQVGSPQAKQRRLENDVHLQRRSLPDSMMHLPEAITLSVRQPNPSAVTVTPIPKKQSDAKAVANVLASRGITVTPASNNNNVSSQRQSAQRQGQRPAQAVASLNLNSAISIIATGSNSQQGFAVPQNRSRTVAQVERPPRPPTVDLTGDTPMNRGQNNMRGGGRMRGRPPGVSGGRHACQVCDKAFSTEESLQQHMVLHRSPNKLPYRCNLCAAQYPTQQGLLQHRQVYHKEPPPGPEIAVPVVDLKQPGVLQRLSNLGIVHYIPLSQLSSAQGGHFGLPIVSVDGARDPAVSNLGAMGASNILSLGPLKQLQLPR